MNHKYLFILLAVLYFSCEKSDDPIEDPNELKACFSYYLIEQTFDLEDSVQFTNCSENATSYLWDFGDGTTSTEKEPKHTYGTDYPYIVKLTAINGDETDVLVDTVRDWQLVEKPNIYIYPTETTDLCVTLDFPQGGEIVTSIPEYGSGWCVNVEPNGKINGEFDFLFYESIQPNIWQSDKGWCIAYNGVENFFSNILQDYNLSEDEINDFKEYWIERLDESPYYLIYPQLNNTINEVIGLNFSQNPDNIFRLFFTFKPCNALENISEPEIISAQRKGFHVIEWGGAVLK